MQKIKSTTLAVMIVMAIGVMFCGIAIAQQEFFEKGFSTPVGPKFVPGEIIVKFKPGVSANVVGEINRKHGTSVLSTSRFAGFKRLKVPKGKTVEGMVATYKRNPNVEYAQLNYICSAFFIIPNDQYYSYQWHFSLINMESAWETQLGGDDSVVVAVLDSGVAYEDHEEFVDLPGPSWRDYWITYKQAPDLVGTSFWVNFAESGNFSDDGIDNDNNGYVDDVNGWDFINSDSHPNDDDAHGTHVTGTIAQTTNNEYGVAGMACMVDSDGDVNSTSIMPVKVLDKYGSGTAAILADGLYYAADNGAHVINMSLGFPATVTPEDIPAITDAVKYAYAAGLILVASSGNNGGGVVSLPAAYPEVIAVGAVSPLDERASYSQYGLELEVVAPGGDDVDGDGSIAGEGVLQETFYPAGDPTEFGLWWYAGTSMAAPHVSGLAALLLAQDPSRTNVQIREILRTTSEDLGDPGKDEEYGYGRIDATAALQATVGPSDEEPPVISDATGATTGTTGEPKTISATITDYVDVVGAAVYYTPIGGSETSVVMVEGVDEVWSADVPVAIDKVGTITYCIVAQDLADNTVRDPSDPLVYNNITVTDNDAPIANAGLDQTAVIGDTVTFDGSGSTDNIGIESYSWDFDGNGEVDATGVTASHSYTETGIYTVTLTVSDEAGNTSDTASDTATVTVTEAPSNDISVSIDMSTTRIKLNGWYTYATATVTINDASGVVSDATVSGTWSGLTTDSDTDAGPTNTFGQVLIDSDAVKNANGTFTFTVDTVTVDGVEYKIGKFGSIAP